MTRSRACALTFEVAGEHVLSKRRHVSDAEGRAGAGPHHDGRRLFLRDPKGATKHDMDMRGRAGGRGGGGGLSGGTAHALMFFSSFDFINHA